MKTVQALANSLEAPLPGEDQAICTIVESLKRTVRRNNPPGKVMRGAHPKLHGCVRAEFIVDADVPPELQHGVFAEAKRFNAFVRFSNSFPGIQHDGKRDVRGCAIKLLDVEGEKVLDNEKDERTQDFVLASHPIFFIRNATDYVPFCLAVERHYLLRGFFGWKPFRCRFREFYTLLRSQIQIANPLGIPYYSQTPYCLGPHAVKYSVRPRGFQPDPAGFSSRRDFLREGMTRYLAEHDAYFDFLVQVQTDRDLMPIEDALVRWNERLSPFRKIATIRIPIQTFDTADRSSFGNNLSFTPWHALEAHRPLGSINRVRRAVYWEISGLRHTLNQAPLHKPKGLAEGGKPSPQPLPLTAAARRRVAVRRAISLAALLVLLGVVALVVVFASSGSGPDPQEERVLTPRAGDLNGLTQEERAEYYHLTEGGGLYPMRMLLALEVETAGPGGRPTFRPFLDNIERFGLIPDPKSELNPYGLPVGVTQGTSAVGIQWMGLNCTACHVGEIHYHGKRFRVDGAPNIVFINRFIDSLFDETHRTAESPVRSVRFLDRMRRVKLVPVPQYPLADYGYKDARQYAPNRDENADPLADLFASDTWGIANRLRVLVSKRNLIQARIDTLKGLPTLKASIAAGTLDGYGRADAFGVGRNELFGSNPLNVMPVDAPVSYPHLWGMKYTRWLHWGSNMNSVMERNIGQALGVGATYDKVTYESTVRLDHLWRLEQLSYALQSPKWPTEIFGPIDQQKRARGKAFFDRTCALCHESPVRGDGLMEYPAFPLDVIGTDPKAAMNFERSVIASDGVKPFPEAAFAIIEKVKRRYYEVNGIPSAKQAEWEMRDLRGTPKFRAPLRGLEWEMRNREPIQTSLEQSQRAAYHAKTLRGIWATAPYLHNGSVPTIYDLLLPAATRPKWFMTGTREYDPVKLGYRYQTDSSAVIAPELQPFILDTSLPGNWNSGHEWWFYDELERDDSKRYDIIEFLKSFDLENELEYKFRPLDKMPDVRAQYPLHNRASLVQRAARRSRASSCRSPRFSRATMEHEKHRQHALSCR
jgi:hypothetical protein